MGVTLILYMLLLITINANGLHDELKWTHLWQSLPRPDIICIQETHLTKQQEFAFALHAQSYNWLYSHGSSSSGGVCIGLSGSLVLLLRK